MEQAKIRQAQFDLFDTARFFAPIEKVQLQERDFRLIVAAVTKWGQTTFAGGIS